VRVIAATHRDLAAAQEQGRFRPDLYFRLNVFPIQVPPLRERRGDIPELVRHFVRVFSRRLNKPELEVHTEVMKRLTGYDWPGNVRELENLIERAMIVADGTRLEIDASWLRSSTGVNQVTADGTGLAELERRAIVDALLRCHGRIYGSQGAAAALGLKATTLYGKMRKHGIPRHPSASPLP
jgi:formate hydrogenlyase transcriptional activator